MAVESTAEEGAVGMSWDPDKFLLGVNYWSRQGGPLMWEQWEPNTVRAEVRHMVRLGFDVCRSFVYGPHFMPAAGRLAPVMLRRWQEYLRICAQEGLGVFATLIVGHMSGENWDFPWRGGRDLYTDEGLLEAQAELCRGVVGATLEVEKELGRRVVAGWVLSNEMPVYGGPAEPQAVARWAEHLSNAIRQLDRSRPVGTGDGVWYLMGERNGFEPGVLAPAVDFYGIHLYPTEIDSMRHALYLEAVLARMDSVQRTISTAKPVVVEEFGGSTAHGSPENLALYVREALHTAFLSGAVGAWIWCFSDFELYGQRPYWHHPFELRFGLVSASGAEKPAAAEVQAFRRFLDKATGGRPVRPLRSPVAIVVPSYLNASYPFTENLGTLEWRIVLEAYALCSMAGVRPELVEEQEQADDRLAGAYTLLVVPCARRLLAPTWEGLAAIVRRGASLYMSYMADSWCHNFDELTGLARDLRWGLVDVPDREVQVEFGDGQAASVEVGSPASPDEWRRFAYLRIRCPEGVRVLARARVGEEPVPALVEVRRGGGRIVFCPFPWEWYALQRPEANRRWPFSRLYSLVFESAGVRPLFTSDHSWVQVRCAQPSDGQVETGPQKGDASRLLVWVINRGWEPARAQVAPATGWKFVRRLYPDGGCHESVVEAGEFHLDRKEIQVWEAVRTST